MKTNWSKRLLSLLFVACLAVSLAPSVLAYDGYQYCTQCGTYSNYTLSYGNKTATTHQLYYICANCGKDQTGGSGAVNNHSFEYYNASYDKCSVCGYLKYYGGSSGSCTHSSYSTSWNGCNWTRTCNNCGAVLATGTSHGNYTYGYWEYDTDTSHRRLRTCGYCGQSEYEYAEHYHYFQRAHSVYTAAGHSASEICPTCNHGFWVGMEDHTFLYGDWVDDGATQHYREKYCQYCDYRTKLYEDHNFVSTCENIYHAQQHKRTVTCSDCGRSDVDYADHTFDDPAWQSCSETHHNRTKHCTDCGFGAYEYEEHVFSQRSVASISDTAHRITVSCVCGEQQITDADHVDANGDGVCDECGHATSRFSVTVPASLSMAVNEYGVVSTATNAAIANNSTDAVKVTSVTANTANGWTLVPFNSSMASAKVDSKQIGFQINDAGSTRTGTSEALSIGSGWTIPVGASLPLHYSAVVSATSEAIRNEQVLTLLFVVDWAS